MMDYDFFFFQLQLFFDRWASATVPVPWKEVEAKLFALNVVSEFHCYFLATIFLFYFFVWMDPYW